MDMRAFFDVWYDRFWIEEDLSAAEDMIPADVVIHGLTDAPQISAEGLKEFATALLGLCKFEDISIKYFCQDGDWAQMLVVFRGVGRDSGAPFVFDAQVLARSDGTQIVEAYNHADFITLFQQMGMMPQDTMARCLGKSNLT